MKLFKLVRNVLLLSAYLLTGITLILTTGNHVLEAASLPINESQDQFLYSFCAQIDIADEIGAGWVEVAVEDTLAEAAIATMNPSTENVDKNASTDKSKKASKKKTSSEKKASKEKKTVISLSKEDKKALLRIVEAEATGEDLKGKMLVANVVLNRVNNDEFPDNVSDVVFQHENGVYQFSPIYDGRYYEVSVSDDTRKAVKKVLEGEDDSQGALYFVCRKKASKKNVRWFDSELTFLFRHGTHHFYK